MKKIIKSVFRFYIEASIHVALAVYALLRVFMFRHELEYDENLVYTVFYGTITGYNFVKYAAIAKLHHRRLTSFLKSIQVFSLVCFIAMCYYMFQLPMRTLLVAVGGAGLVFLYAIPLVYSKNIRSIGGLKIYVVAFCWAVAVVLLPTIHWQLDVGVLFLKEFVQIALLVFVLVIPFDIRDLSFDDKNLKTIPQQIGIKKAKFLALALVVCFLFLEKEFIATWNLGTVFFAFCVAAVILFTAKKPKKYYCSFWVESTPILWCLLLNYF